MLTKHLPIKTVGRGRPLCLPFVSEHLILSIDQGSSHTRAALFTDRGEKLCQASTPFHTYHPKPGYVEHDAKELLNSVRTAIQKVVLQAKSHKKKIAALGIANQRSTVLCWDAKTGEPLSPVVSWQDRRSENSPLLQQGAFDIQEKTGLPSTCYYSATKLNALLNHIGRNKKNLLAGNINTFLIWHLTGGKYFLTDPTNAQRMLLYNINTQAWDSELLHHFRIPRKILPDILPNTAVFGNAVLDGLQIPITASIGDQQSSLIGLGGLDPGLANVNYGTGGFFLMNTGPQKLKGPGLLTSIGWSSQNKTTYLMEGTLNAVWALFAWLQQIGILKSTKNIDSACYKSKERLTFLPALTGLAAPYWKQEARGALFGLSASTSKEDIIRSAVEGIAFLMNDIYQALPRQSARQNTKIIASGGGSTLSYLMQFQADLFGKALCLTADLESTVRGAAFLAGKGIGITDETQFQFAPIRKKILPRMKPKERESLIKTWQEMLVSYKTS
jgi:glycerol kinase